MDEFELLIEESMQRQRSSNGTGAARFETLFQLKEDMLCEESTSECSVHAGKQSLGYQNYISYYPTSADYKEVEGLSCPA